jgi:hypothetical protein
MNASQFEKAVRLPERFAKAILHDAPESSTFSRTTSIVPFDGMQQAISNYGLDNDSQEATFLAMRHSPVFSEGSLLVPGGRYLFAPISVKSGKVLSLWDLGCPGKHSKICDLLAFVHLPGMSVAELCAACPTACGTGLRVIAKLGSWGAR